MSSKNQKLGNKLRNSIKDRLGFGNNNRKFKTILDNMDTIEDISEKLKTTHNYIANNTDTEDEKAFVELLVGIKYMLDMEHSDFREKFSEIVERFK